MILKYTVLQNKSGGRFFTSYTESCIDDLEIIGHCNTVEDAQLLCNATEEVNIKLYLDSLPKEFIDTAKKVLKSSKPSKTLTPIGRMFYDDECRGNQW